jgi:hypothetical protein
MSKPLTPHTAMPRANPSARAVISPMRRPVYGAGPRPATTATRSRGASPASAKAASIKGISSSTWARWRGDVRVIGAAPGRTMPMAAPAEVSSPKIGPVSPAGA